MPDLETEPALAYSDPQGDEAETAGMPVHHYDCVVIGAGMSGLAAAIRLAMFDRKVLVLERHNAVGGLNSFYALQGRKYDVGLHAMTNYVPPGTKGAPLTKILRQLRLQHGDFDLAEQVASRIAFPDFSLTFTNDFRDFEAEVARVFPSQIDAFRKLVAELRAFDETALDTPPLSTRGILIGYFGESRLVDALLLPTCYYGSATPGDLDWSQFAIMMRALFFEGFARPWEGVRRVLRVLRERLRAAGGERRMRCGVRQLRHQDQRITEIVLDDGSSITADHVISSIGWAETLRLTGEESPGALSPLVGGLSFVETLSAMRLQPTSLGWDETIVFFNDGERFCYESPRDLVDPRSGVICLPNNYRYSEGRLLDEGWLRVTALANFEGWSRLRSEGIPEKPTDARGGVDPWSLADWPSDAPAAYCEAKARWFNALQSQALRFLPGRVSPEALEEATLATDMFTPTTITRYTGHGAGAIYGSPTKNKSGLTAWRNLYLCGTDQGFLGITGAMLSGISMANAHVLAARSAS